MNKISLAFSVAFAFMLVASPRIARATPPVEHDAVVQPRDEAPKLGVYTTLGYLASPGGNGAAFETGLRYAIGRHFALGFDAAWGAFALQKAVEDRWWLLPSMSFVLPTRIGGRRTTFDLGAGFGLGTTSHYPSFSKFVDGPFMPEWAYQFAPAVGVHASASVALTRVVDAFMRVDAGSVLLPPSSNTTLADSSWLLISFGTQFRLL